MSTCRGAVTYTHNPSASPGQNMPYLRGDHHPEHNTELYSGLPTNTGTHTYSRTYTPTHIKKEKQKNKKGWTRIQKDKSLSISSVSLFKSIDGNEWGWITYFYFMCMSGLSVCLLHLCLVPMVLDLLELERWTTVNHHVRSGNQTHVLYKSSQCSWPVIFSLPGWEWRFNFTVRPTVWTFVTDRCISFII